MRYILLLSLMILTACSGYKKVYRVNPFSEYNINSISVPIFVNYSNISGIGPILTQDFIKELAHYRKLTVYSSNKNSDAVLIGIIDSAEKVSQRSETAIRSYIEGDLKKSIGNRPEFYLPLTTVYKAELKIILLDKKSNKIILDRNFAINGSFTRSLEETLNVDSPGVTNFTKTKYSFIKSLRESSSRISKEFRNVVLNVF